MSRLTACALAIAGCGDVTLIELVDTDRPVPDGVDAICLGVADVSLDGGHVGQLYRLDEPRRDFPQTLRVEAGAADAAFAWVRGDRGGVPVVRASAPIDFGSAKVTLDVGLCGGRGAGALPTVRGGPAGPPDARLVASQGAGGTLVVALGAEPVVLDARGGALVTAPAPAPPAGTITAAIALDIDGDCDDDLVVAATGGPPAVWRRDGRSFTVVGELGTTPVLALAAADVNRDRQIDLVAATATSLALWRNGGGGAFIHVPQALSAGTRATAIRALALGDLDGDGNADLVVGQNNAPLVAWLGDAGGAGSFAAADGVVAPVPLAVQTLSLVDVDNDFDPDLVVAVAGQGPRLFIDREGILEDQTFLRFPQPMPVARAVAFGGWDLDCQADAVIAADAGGATLRGLGDGALETEGAAPAATDVVMTDLDDDGALDAVLATPEGARWLAR